jgi:RimJ/RimL family protein N-acetyltransferase
MKHCDALVAAQSESRDTYAFTFVSANAAEMQEYVATAIALREAGEAYPFVTVDVATGRVVGTTRFANLYRYAWPAGSPFDRGPELPDDVEIGWTWLAASAQRTHINTEAKLVMLRFAFESWRVHVVRLNTDARNERSRNAIMRIGGKLDGILRAQRAASDGAMRDTACYSIIEAEWPAVRAALEARLQR